MQKFENISYGNEKLDLYLPDNKDFDLFVYFHGGGLERGDKANHPHIFAHFISCGVAVASVEYRKLPDAQYPDFIEDAAADAPIKTVASELLKEDLERGNKDVNDILRASGKKVATMVLTGATLYVGQGWLKKNFDPSVAADYMFQKPSFKK